MSKRFLKQIGYIALLICVSHITPQPADAMRRAKWEDYDKVPNVKRYVDQTQIRDDQLLPNHAAYDKRPGNDIMWTKAGIMAWNPPTKNALYVCKVNPNDHGLETTVNDSPPPTKCKTCAIIARSNSLANAYYND